MAVKSLITFMPPKEIVISDVIAKIKHSKIFKEDYVWTILPDNKGKVHYMDDELKTLILPGFNFDTFPKFRKINRDFLVSADENQLIAIKAGRYNEFLVCFIQNDKYFVVSNCEGHSSVNTNMFGYYNSNYVSNNSIKGAIIFRNYSPKDLFYYIANIAKTYILNKNILTF